MKISQLSREAGLPLPTVKYYLRAGLLPPGQATSATQAQYGEAHLQRLRLVRALADVGGLSIAAVRDVLRVVDAAEPGDVAPAVAMAHSRLPPAVDEALDTTRARAALAELGWHVDAHGTAIRQLQLAMNAAASVGLALDGDRLRTYAESALRVAEADVATVPTGSAREAVQYAVAGTVLFEPILLSLRRLAQAHVSYHRWSRPTGTPAAGGTTPGRSDRRA